MSQRKYDSTVARIAGNIAPALIAVGVSYPNMVAITSVEIARAIVKEVESAGLEESR